MNHVWIRRGYGCFVKCKNETKAKAKAAHWYEKDQGDDANHKVIGMFVSSNVNLPSYAQRTVLYQ